MLSVLPQSSLSFQNFKGDGVLIPPVFSTVNFDALTLFRQQGKLVFFEKEPPYTDQDKLWINSSSALITSKVPETLEQLSSKTACF